MAPRKRRSPFLVFFFVAAAAAVATSFAAVSSVAALPGDGIFDALDDRTRESVKSFPSFDDEFDTFDVSQTLSKCERERE